MSKKDDESSFILFRCKSKDSRLERAKLPSFQPPSVGCQIAHQSDGVVIDSYRKTSHSEQYASSQRCTYA